MLPGFPRTRWPRRRLSEGYAARISVKISRIYEFPGNNDRSARVLFVQHRRGQGEWLRQNPRYDRVLTESFDLLHRVLDEQHPRCPVITPLASRIMHADITFVLYELNIVCDMPHRVHFSVTSSLPSTMTSDYGLVSLFISSLPNSWEAIE